MSRACLPTRSLIISCITAASFQVLSKQLSEICKTLRYKSKHSGVAESGEGGTSEVAAQQMRALEVYDILALTDGEEDINELVSQVRANSSELKLLSSSN